jgi:hypothetical protein
VSNNHLQYELSIHIQSPNTNQESVYFHVKQRSNILTYISIA